MPTSLGVLHDLTARAAENTKNAMKAVMLINAINKSHVLQSGQVLGNNGTLVTYTAAGATTAGAVTVLATTAMGAGALAVSLKGGYELGKMVVELDKNFDKGRLVRGAEIALTGPFWLIHNTQEAVTSALGSK